MSCRSREISGSCGHHQCEHPSESTYECVDVAFMSTRGFCEVGLGCVDECKYSYEGDEDDEANRAFENRYPEDA